MPYWVSFSETKVKVRSWIVSRLAMISLRALPAVPMPDIQLSLRVRSSYLEAFLQESLTKGN